MDSERVNLRKRENLKKEIDRYAEDKIKVYSILWGLCTNAMQNAVNMTREFSRWNEAKELETLWTAITQLSVVGPEVNIDEEVNKMRAATRFLNIRQFPDEELGDFFNRFTSEVDISGNEFIEIRIYWDENDPDIIAEREEVEARIRKRMEIEFLDNWILVIRSESTRFRNPRCSG